MYLYASKYISNFDNDIQHNNLIKIIGLEPSDLKFNSQSGSTINITVGYWRKANAVHDWFVQNIQNGEDDCQKYYVEREDLATLRNLCQNQIDNPTEDILPPTSGFFFGSTEKDEWYFEQLKYTVKMIDFILNNKNFEDFEFYYQSSW